MIIDTFVLKSTTMASEVRDAIIAGRIELTATGSSTLTLTLHDDKRVLLRSGIFKERITATLAELPYELVQVRKNGPELAVTFEDAAVAKLRRRTKPRKVAPGKMNHVEFARLLVSEEPSVKFKAPAGLAPKSKVELARGTPGEEQPEDKEDTWEALGRIAAERNWRRFMRQGELWYMPDTYLLEQPVAFNIREYKDGIDEVDFDFDTGKPAASATAKAYSNDWEIWPGDIAKLHDLGPGTGNWIVESISSSLFEPARDIKLVQGRPILPEPKEAK